MGDDLGTRKDAGKDIEKKEKTKEDIKKRESIILLNSNIPTNC